MLKDNIIEWVPTDEKVTWISAICPVPKIDRGKYGVIQVYKLLKGIIQSANRTK